MTEQEAGNNQGGSPTVANQAILLLMELSRRARRAESAKALEFMLVNQSISLVHYAIALLWVADEGVVLQSGVSHVERNSPFIQWMNEVADVLSDQTALCEVQSDMLLPALERTWSDWLPPYAVWVPITRPSGHAGLLLCRDKPFNEGELVLLQEWIETWTHAWRMLAAPSVHGELTRFWHRWLGLLPSRETLLSECRKFWLGTQMTAAAVRANPRCMWLWLKSLVLAGRVRVIAWHDWIRQEGADGLRRALIAEARSIWADKRRRWKWIVWTLILFPVRLSVLVPGELVPENPAVIRVPIDGVVDEFFVSPNEQVVSGQPLLKLDLTALLSKAQVAQQEILVATQEYRQSALQSLTDAKSRGQLAAQEGKAAERRIEADYTQAMLDKATINAPRGGVVILDDPTEWIGKPVAAGEKVMVVATEGQVEIEAWIPVGDMLEVPKGASVTLYLNAKPFSPVSGTMRYVGHEPLSRPDGTYAYRVRASLPSGETGPRVGLKGTAKVNGEFVPLSYWILRKPLAAIRQYLGI